MLLFINVLEKLLIKKKIAEISKFWDVTTRLKFIETSMIWLVTNFSKQICTLVKQGYNV